MEYLWEIFHQRKFMTYLLYFIIFLKKVSTGQDASTAVNRLTPRRPPPPY